ncbi:SDR family oxidoreductase [Saccharopolyspora hordei]|uniref:NAD(P)-dependent dehydrogenase (Short-subunit alcohol dehydrogenase family) n=1 Tax=Saccharopolyspora hordei TaxID=1838 RepID=A0A853ANW1_9PSEU|nr:SDR family oxidoreductase [Saccharopolyspora hordei]NYI85646.1 NAD(P)-dependent dehydrogenase (short-subunit alcohol dehydrogenase family) [Saccharopolyspora hordei]
MSDLPETAHAQQQRPPGATGDMEPRPRDEMRDYVGAGHLAGKKALITGGDSGIGRAVAVAFAKEGADVAICYVSEDEEDDARHTASLVQEQGRSCHVHRRDLGSEDTCVALVRDAVEQLGGLDVLVNHAGTQAPQQDLRAISDEQFDRTFKVNVYAVFWLCRAALDHMPDGAAIINTGSVNGLRGNKTLMDYSATKGAVHAFTQSLAQALVGRRIRVNCVAPGPVWTPLIPSTFPEEKVEGFGEQTPMGRMAHPDEIAPSYVFFASDRLSSYYSGEVLAPVGGETHPG